MYDLTVDLSDPENDSIVLNVPDSLDYVSLIGQSIVLSPSGVVTEGDGVFFDTFSLYLNDGINESIVKDVLFIVKENHPPLIEGRFEAETTV